jgi:hypothetical protein
VSVGDLLRWVLIVALFPTAAATLWVGRYLVRNVIDDPAKLLPWLEESAPLKGQWLRLLIAFPSILVGATLTFFVTWYLTVYGIGLLLVVSGVGRKFF